MSEPPDAQKAGKAPAGGVADRLARRSAPATTIGGDRSEEDARGHGATTPDGAEETGRWRAEARLEGLQPVCLTADPLRLGRVYCGTWGRGLWRSEDAGESGGPLDAHTLATHPLAPDRVYAAAGDGMMREGHDYAESLDGGQTWSRFGEGLSHHYLWGLAVDPTDPDTVISGA
jgi:hypothetical protein